ncbi:MAG: sulfatase-like hydrolase/transferase [Flavobacteriaceae bacterium]|nr:sulfatase-like hydrolase/transferase [Flavobacteriaceae bacterium]
MVRLLILLIFLLFNFSCSQERSKPNIILIMADDLGYECLNVNGGKYQTPNLDKLALNGIRFENCHSQPICTPSRVRIMTGKTNKKNYVDFGILDKKEVVFSQLLKKNGYKTLIAGKWQLQLDKTPDYQNILDLMNISCGRLRQKEGIPLD